MTLNTSCVHPKRLAVHQYFANFDDLDNAIIFDDLDDAILGIAEQHCGVGPLVAYSMRKILDCYESRGMSPDEALEHFGRNCECFSAGSGTPIIVNDYTPFC